LHPNYPSSLTLNTIAWLSRKASPLGSSQPNGDSRVSLCGISYCPSSVQSNIRVGSPLSLLMSHGSVLPYITNGSGFGLAKDRLKGRVTRFKTRKSW
jgi:hypothetical protein